MEKPAVLMVDDQEPNLRVLETLLDNLDVDLVPARSGGDALARVLERDFAAILMDVRMPGMDGFETAELIRKRPRSAHIPIIFVTAGEDDLETISRGYSVGGVDYIKKPLNGDMLRSKVKVFVELYRKSRDLALKSEELLHKNLALEGEVRKRQHAEHVLEESRDFYQTLFDGFPAMVWRSDVTGRMTHFNRSWISFVGRPLGEETLTGWMQELHPQDREAAAAGFFKAFQARESFEMEYRQRREDGEYRWILNHGQPYRRLDGTFAGFIGSCTDITPRKESEEATRSAIAELEAFSYTVSHDLRAPLRSMSGFCQILLEDYLGKPADRSWKEYVDRIAVAAKQMDALIQDLLAFSRLAREKVDMGPIEIGPILVETIADLRLKESPIHVAEPFAAVHGNRVLLSQVFSNLISNALKFLPKGKAPDVRIRSETGTDGWVRIWVEDNGIGIAPEFHEKIFQVFERLNEATAYPGTGIGLAIVRRAVGRMGGRSGVVSAEGAGSRFWIELPPAGTAPERPQALAVGETRK